MILSPPNKQLFPVLNKKLLCPTKYTNFSSNSNFYFLNQIQFFSLTIRWCILISLITSAGCIFGNEFPTIDGPKTRAKLLIGILHSGVSLIRCKWIIINESVSRLASGKSWMASWNVLTFSFSFVISHALAKRITILNLRDKTRF